LIYFIQCFDGAGLVSGTKSVQ